MLQTKPKSDNSDQDDKLKSLMQHRKKNRLCYKCGEKWSHNHKCPAQVSLHVIEELFDALQPPDSEDDDCASSEEESEPAVVLAVTPQASATPAKRRTMRLKGCLGNREVIILVDSGSSGTFVSTELSQHLNWPMEDCQATQYAAVDGTQLMCNKVLKGLQWTTQGHSFVSDAGILPLKCYDMILGEDWLEDCSPMSNVGRLEKENHEVHSQRGQNYFARSQGRFVQMYCY